MPEKEYIYIYIIYWSKSCTFTVSVYFHYNYSSKKIKWKKKLTPGCIQPFTRPTGPRVDIPTVVKEIFFLFFTSSVLEHIVTESNRYAQECKGELFTTWQPITVDELLAYMGFMMLMGIVRLPRIEDYWKKDAIYHYTPVANRISRERFRELHKFLHFVNNSSLAPPGTPGYDKLGKLRPIISMIGEQFATVCDPGKEVSIDEAMIPFKGRSSLKQYLPMKPVKRGIKVWVRADANTRYVSAFDVYAGKKGNTTEKGLGATVVKHLCEKLYHSYRHIYYDNFFSSVDLGLHILRSGPYS